MCKREHSPETLAIIGALQTALETPNDQTELGARVVELLGAPGRNPSWRPRLKVTPAGARKIARVYLGDGAESFVYFTPEGLARFSGCVPPRWREALASALDEIAMMDRTPGRGGFLAARVST